MCIPFPDPVSAAAMLQASMRMLEAKPGAVIRVDSPDAIKWLSESQRRDNCRNCGAPPDDGHACSYCGTPRG